jgi:hypothetical protein
MHYTVNSVCLFSSIGPGAGAVTVAEIICILAFNDAFKNIHHIYRLREAIYFCKYGLMSWRLPSYHLFKTLLSNFHTLPPPAKEKIEF